MAKRLTAVSAVLTVLAAVLALMLAATAPALAKHDDDHAKEKASHEASDKDGDADSDSSTAYTEDTDSDGQANCPDRFGDDDNQHPSGKDRSCESGGSGNQGNAESAPDEDGHGPERDYEGTDKPNGAGGVDKEDQDGNNGCGNDDDFEDDNEGWCGHKPKKEKPEEEEEAPSVVKPAEKPCDKDHDMSNGVQSCEKKDKVESKRIEDKPCDEDNNMANGIQTCGEETPEEAEAEAPGPVSAAGVPLPAVPAPDQVLGLQVRGKSATKGGAIAPGVTPRGARVRGQVLPFTGGSVLGFVLLAIGLVAAGYLMLTARRRT